MKTLIFSIPLLICGLNSAALADDAYDDLPWLPFRADVQPPATYLPHALAVATFRTFFHKHTNPLFADLIKECGVPTDIVRDINSPGGAVALPAHMPMYYGGHLFRYPLPDGGHVYVWTGEDDQPVMRADHFFSNGRVEPLYLRPQ